MWTLRVLIVAGIVLLCALAKSGIPSWALAIAWSPNGLFLAAFMRGLLPFPASFERIHPLEPAIYRGLGVGMVKRLVANPVWPRLMGFPPPPKPKERRQFLAHIERDMKCAEICHAATFVVASLVALLYVAGEQTDVAVWITVFNVALNAYPVMLQRANRSRLPRASVDGERP